MAGHKETVRGSTAQPLKPQDFRPANNVPEKQIRAAVRLRAMTGCEVFVYDVAPGIQCPDGMQTDDILFVCKTNNIYATHTIWHEYGHLALRMNRALPGNAETLYAIIPVEERNNYATVLNRDIATKYGADAKSTYDYARIREEFIADMFGVYGQEQDTGDVSRLLDLLGVSQETYEAFRDLIDHTLGGAAITESDLRDDADTYFAPPRWLSGQDEMDAYLTTGKTGHIRDAKARAYLDGKSISITSYDQFKGIVQDIITGDGETTTMTFGTVEDRLAGDLLVRSKGTIDVRGKYLELVPSDIGHAYNEHVQNPSHNGEIPVPEYYFYYLPILIDEYDVIPAAANEGVYGTKFTIAFYTNDYAVVIPCVVSSQRVSIHPKTCHTVSWQEFGRKYKNIEPRSGYGEDDNSSAYRSKTHSVHSSETPIDILCALRENRNPENVNFSQRSLAEPTFSKLEREVEAYKGDKIASDGLVNYLRGRGVKAEEIKWLGLEQYLDGKKSVTKASLPVRGAT